MRLHINPDGTKTMDWDGRDPEEYTDYLANLAVSLLEKQYDCKYTPRNKKKKKAPAGAATPELGA